jgi:hypothetical protein
VCARHYDVHHVGLVGHVREVDHGFDQPTETTLDLVRGGTCDGARCEVMMGYPAVRSCYERLLRMIPGDYENLALPAELFLAMVNQMYGAGSQMLRRRLPDVHALTRRAIELAATAYRLWEHPELTTVYLKAYSSTPKQWIPSKTYREAFSTKKLFEHPGDLWEGLKMQYGLHSAIASHAGIASTVWHEQRGNTRYAPFIAPEGQDILRAWYSVLLPDYMDLWHIFFDIFRECSDQVTAGNLEKDFLAWCERVERLRAQRAPWIVEHSQDECE